MVQPVFFTDLEGCDSHFCFNFMLDNTLQRQKLVSVGEKLVSDFELFPITHPPPLQTPFWGYWCVDICQTINIFLHPSS